MEERNLQVKEVNFDGDKLTAIQNEKGIYAIVRQVCEYISLSEGQIKRQTENIQSDLVLSKGYANLRTLTTGGYQNVLCIQIDFLPLWLAKISITPTMKRENPTLADKLINYQLKAKDVLAAAFLPSQYQSSEISAVLAQLKNMQIQLDQNTKSLALLADERQKHIEAITNLSYELKTQIQIHPLSEKRDRVLYKLTEELFKKELTDESTSQVYNEQLSKLSSMSLYEIRKTLRLLSKKSFKNEFEFQYDISDGNAPFSNYKSVNNIRYKQSHSPDWAFFSMANVYIHLYYGEVLLDTGAHTRFYFPLKQCNRTYAEFTKKARCFEFNLSDYKLSAHFSLIASRLFVSIAFKEYKKLEEESLSTCGELIPLKDYLIMREIICKVMYSEAGYEG